MVGGRLFIAEMGDLELRYAHLGHRRTPAREAQRVELQTHTAEIQAEREERNAAPHRIDHSHIPAPADRRAVCARDPAEHGKQRDAIRRGKPAMTERWCPRS